MAILLMHGNTDARNGKEIKTPMLSIKIGEITPKEKIQMIPTGREIELI